METPCESTWNIPIMINRKPPNEAKFYSFSIRSIQFELYLLHEKGMLPKCMQGAKEDPEGETMFTSFMYDCFIAGSFSYPTCLVRELKPSEK